MSRRLLTRESAGGEAAELLAESARIAIVELPRLLTALRRRGSRWEEEDLLDTVAAGQTAEEITVEMAVVEPQAESLLKRQREVVARLRELTRLWMSSSTTQAT